MTGYLALLQPAPPVAPTSIAGRFRIAGTSPDGDSVRFTADEPGVWRDAGIRARVNAAGSTQLRLDAIDALETHYAPPGGGGQWRQPPEFAVRATESLLTRLGFDGWRRDPDTGTISNPEPAEVPGWIVTAGADLNGRPVSFVLAGDRATADARWSAGGGDGPVALTPDMLGATVNAGQLADGLAYPTFYTDLAADLRDALAAITATARTAGTGIWAADVTTSGFVLTGRTQLETEVVLLPKLFRRLAEYLSLDGPETGPSAGVSLAGFRDFLAVSADAVRVLPDGPLTTLADLVRVEGQRVALAVEPERLVFSEKETRVRALTD